MNPNVTIEPHYNTLFHFPSCVQSSCNDPKKLRTETLRQWWHDRSWFQATPMSDCRYGEENGSTAMLTAKRSAGVALEFNLSKV